MKLFGLKRNTGELPLVDVSKVKFGGFAILPQPFKKPEKAELDVEPYVKRLKALSQNPVRQLEDASNVLSSINRLLLKAEKRLELLNAIIQVIYPVISIAYDKYQTQHNSLPESKERRAILVACIDVVSLITIIYKQLFSDIYADEKRKYNRNAPQVYEYAFRVMEFLLVDQRFRALRYQKQAVESALDCNRLFFAMAKHKHMDDLLPLHGPTGIKARPKGQGSGHIYQSSIRLLYKSIQLFGVLDVSTWAPHLFHVPDAMQESLNTGLRLVADTGEGLAPGVLYIAQRQARPPLFVRPEKENGVAINLDYNVFYDHLVKDYEKIASMKFIDDYDEKQLMDPIRLIAETDRAPVLELMLASLRKRERRSNRHAVFKDNVVKIYFNRDEVMHLLVDLADRNMKQMLRSSRITNQLSPKSAHLYLSEKGANGTQWEMLNFSAGGILVSTLETDFSYPVQLGQLVAFIIGDEKQPPSLGFVCRLNRPQDRLVEVGIARLSNYAEAVVIHGVGEADNELYQSAILIQDLDDNWQMVVVQQQQLQPGKPIKLIRGNKEVPSRLGDVCLTKNEFTVYELRSPGLTRRVSKSASVTPIT